MIQEARRDPEQPGLPKSGTLQHGPRAIVDGTTRTRGAAWFHGFAEFSGRFLAPGAGERAAS
jgi:hypothetical protein